MGNRQEGSHWLRRNCYKIKAEVLLSPAHVYKSIRSLLLVLLALWKVTLASLDGE
jgi:hypothetical protein